MMASNNSIKKTLIVAFSLCVICSVVVSSAAVVLKPKQLQNQALDRKSNILQVTELYKPGDDVEEKYAELITPRVVNLETGEYSDDLDPNTYDQFDAARDPATSRTLSGDDDIAGIGRQEKFSTVYLVGDPDDPDQIVMPIRGQGLWGLMEGFLSVRGDGNTIVGLSYYDQSETPGLGGEVDNPRWKAKWDGKKIYEDGDYQDPQIQLVKGGASGEYEVDALSGASLTSRGVTNMLRFWLSNEGYAPYLARFHDDSQGGA
ncbi:Na(+)-translocating NADH-quinone reductase subunit C [Salinicola sp. LHM]|uniref:Na(+)-translocating NADH-quinone reductase subunit C n=1 Tax=Salinicola TaxID=404432 RepID=UPI000DA16AF5|nr:MULTISPECIES: Na(+)-translocating NADH-quinone reductase subunit C [Salinicola]MDF3917689.1 Na(+)-translocating NADH-quinone reductase subunit C [Salinicola salarius]MEC8916827.1 Na(+)-translocating NADH-quinone reductase subunit C [Pseudomonadota bacterium]MED5500130.1 Na(+)-translocating NADH-quinone reductase subunit C [Pseudomonadota bacterium]WQH35016.1 Na(+)-translocating NADH-quinone reductase subunit C [Salinicola sp. LHM]